MPAEHQGNPAVCSNSIIWLDFDPEVPHQMIPGQGIDVVDSDTYNSKLIVEQDESFVVSTIFWLGGIQAIGWKKSNCKFTISYYAEPMTAPGNPVQLGVATIATSQYTSTANYTCSFGSSPYLIFDETVTQVTFTPTATSQLQLGAYRLTALVSFNSNRECDCPLPYNAYTSGPILEVAASVEHT